MCRIQSVPSWYHGILSSAGLGLGLIKVGKHSRFKLQFRSNGSCQSCVCFLAALAALYIPLVSYRVTATLEWTLTGIKNRNRTRVNRE